jgi:hypothetical protein
VDLQFKVAGKEECSKATNSVGAKANNVGGRIIRVGIVNKCVWLIGWQSPGGKGVK